jgi:hypothetical protein
MNLASHNDTTRNNNNQYKSNNPYVADFLESITFHHKMIAELKSELDRAKNHLDTLQRLRKEAESIYRQAVQLTDDIHQLLFPLKEDSPNDQ